MRVAADVVGGYKARFKRKTGAVRVSLRTKDRKQAQRLAAKHLDHYEALFALVILSWSSRTRWAAVICPSLAGRSWNDWSLAISET